MRKIISFVLCLTIAVSMLHSNIVFAATESYTPQEKEDEILVYTDASGVVTEKKGYVTIVGSNSMDPIRDKTVLSDITNVSGNENFSVNDDGTITWENVGNDISYIGTLNAELPFTMKVTYFLNDEEISPEDLAGKSGHIKVIYSFENLVTVDVEFDGEKYNTYIPLLTVTSITLPMEGFNNVESLDGGLVVEEFGEKYFLMGVTAPGTSEALNLEMLGLDEYVTIPDSFGFTADVTDFQMPSAVTCVTPHVLDKLNLSSIKTPEDIQNKIDELVTATERLVDGSSELADGTDLLSEGIGQFVKKFTDGINKISEGSIQLDNDLYDLEEKKNALKNEAGDLMAYLDELLIQLNAFELPDADSVFSPELLAAESKLNEDAALLIEALEVLKGQLEEIQAFAEEAQADIDKIKEIGNLVYEELSSIDLDQIIADATELAKQQAFEAAKEELSGFLLSDEQIYSIMESIMSKVDVSSVADEAREHIAKVEAALSEIPEVEIPEFEVDIDPIISILKDMEVQFAVLQDASGKQEEMIELLNSANEFLNTVKGNSEVIKKKSSELISGLDFADSVIQNAHSYINTLKNAVSESNEGSKKLVNGVYALDDGAKQLADGTEQYYKEGILTAADYAKQATLQAFFNRSKAHILAADKYTNLTGIEEGTRGSIRFTVKTEAITVSN